jgi:hypothetical protein
MKCLAKYANLQSSAAAVFALNNVGDVMMDTKPAVLGLSGFPKPPRARRRFCAEGWWGVS